MSFDDEWAGLRADAAKRQEAGTRLNSYPADASGRGGPSGPQLKVTSSVLEDRAGKAETVHTDFTSADDETMKETEQVGASLKGFKSGPAFGTFQARWRSEMRYVSGLLQKDVAGDLRAAAADFEVRDKKEADRYKRERKKGSKDAPPDLV